MTSELTIIRKPPFYILLALSISIFLLLPLSVVEAADEETAAPSIEYLPLEPKFIVNLQGRKAYLRTNIQLMIEGQSHADTIKMHSPAIRHSLIMLLGSYDRDQLSNPDMLEDVREKALQTVKDTLDKYASSTGVKDLFFTEFLVQ